MVIPPNPDFFKGCFFGCKPRLVESGLSLQFRVLVSRSTGWNAFSLPHNVRLSAARMAWKSLVAGNNVDLMQQFFPVSKSAAGRGEWEDYQVPKTLFVDGCPEAWVLVCLRGSDVEAIFHQESHTHPDILTIRPLPFLTVADWTRTLVAYHWLDKGQKQQVKAAVLPNGSSASADEWIVALFNAVARASSGLPTVPIAGDLFAEARRMRVPLSGCQFSDGMAVLL